MRYIADALRHYPEIAIFLTLALGFWLGQFKIGKFSLGVVTSTLLAGVLIGQLNITISPIVKSVFFLMFLFAVGYGVGPQFFNGLKKDGLQLVLLGAVLCVACLLTVFVIAKVMGYHAGQAAGLLAGSCTISAVLGVATDTINTLSISPEDKARFTAAMPVAYAVTYIYGTAGSAWILATLGPKLLRINLPEECKQYEAKMGGTASGVGISAYQQNVVRAYRIRPEFAGHTVADFEHQFAGQRVFAVRVRENGRVTEAEPDTVLKPNAVLAVVGRREALVEHASELGPEVDDRELLDFPGELLDVVVTNKELAGHTLKEIAESEGGRGARGVFLRKLIRTGREMPFAPGTIVQRGDTLQIVGPLSDVERVAARIGYADRATEKTDMLFMGLGIVIGALIGTLAVKVGGVPLSLSTSGGALIAGLVCGWLRSVHRTFGRIPAPALWVFNNVGLNTFIAVVGISSGPTFIAGLKESGLGLLVSGIIATTLPFILALLFGKYVLKMNPAILLGACAGGRTTTAALGALEEEAKSKVPALGYTVPYAVGNTLLIIWGVVIVLLMG